MSADKFAKGCVLMVAMSCVSVAFAQEQSSGRLQRFYQPVPPLPPELALSYHHASTALEGALRGSAEYLNGLGSYGLALSQAMICREQARQLALEYRERFVSDQIAWREWLEADRQLRMAERRAANLALRPKTFEVYRLKTDQLDRTAGTIVWPTVLRTAEYSELRSRLDDMFCDDACGACPLAAKAGEVARCVESLRVELRRNRASMTRAEWLAASKFLSGVKVEAEFPLGGAGSADPLTAIDSRTTVGTGPARSRDSLAGIN